MCGAFSVVLCTSCTLLKRDVDTDTDTDILEDTGESSFIGLSGEVAVAIEIFKGREEETEDFKS